VGGAAWSKLLNRIQGTLVSLHLKKVEVTDRYDSSVGRILPFPFPNLESLCVRKCDWEKDASLFMKNLTMCSKLDDVHLGVEYDERSDNSYLLDLIPISANFGIKFDVFYEANKDDPTGDISVFISFVTSLGDKVDRFRLILDGNWNARFNLALQLVADRCINLTIFEFGTSSEWGSVPEVRQAKLSLAPMFADAARVWKFRNIFLIGEYDESILWSILENCVNVESMKIVGLCPQLTDHHLITWAHRGGRLSKLLLYGCANITDEGLIPILINSGGKLSSCAILDCPGITEVTYLVCIDFCRYVKKAYFPNQALLDLAASKCYTNAKVFLYF